jgi:hypothetical protein
MILPAYEKWSYGIASKGLWAMFIFIKSAAGFKALQTAEPTKGSSAKLNPY